MKCEAVQNRLYEHLNALLSDPKRREVEAHVQDCAECHKAFEKAKTELALLKRWRVEPRGPDLVNVNGSEPAEREE